MRKSEGNMVLPITFKLFIDTGSSIIYTIDTLDNLFPNPSNFVAGLPRTHFLTFLELVLLNSYFIFNNVLYKQIEGLGMGLPLGPTLPKIFLCVSWRRIGLTSAQPHSVLCFIIATLMILFYFLNIPLMYSFLDYLNVQQVNIRNTVDIRRPMVDCLF